MPRKLASGANRNHCISCAGAGGSGLSLVSQLTIETVKAAVNITVNAYPNLTIPASRSKRAMSIKAEKSGNPGIKNRTAATKPEDNSLGSTEPKAPKISVNKRKQCLPSLHQQSLLQFDERDGGELYNEQTDLQTPPKQPTPLLPAGKIKIRKSRTCDRGSERKNQTAPALLTLCSIVSNIAANS